MNNELQQHIHELINKSLDGSITASEFEELNHLIKSDPECAAYYVSSIRIHQAFFKAGRLFREHTGENLSDSSLSLQEFAEYEKTAPVIQVTREKAQPDPVQDAVMTTSRRKISRLPMVTVLVSCAALLLIMLYVYMNPQAQEVATLIDCINPQWQNAGDSIPIGSRLSTSKKAVTLQQGIIKILYDNDIEVLIEAPAEFQLLSSKEMSLKSGSLYAKVSQAGRGFSVLTSNVRIVDLGTEFGVCSGGEGKTELHVFKGKTTLTVTADKTAKKLGVISGQAKEIGAAGIIKDIQLNKEGFVRSIDSKSNLVWRGQKLDLSDIISLGNGLGTGQTTGRINPVSGFTDNETTPDIPTKGYLPLTKTPFIDGIFVPDGHAEQIISSQGDVFRDCPQTSGIYYADLIANPRPGLFTTNTRKGTIQFDGQFYNDRSHPCVVFHANLGVTFNLNAIRAAYPDAAITRFVSKIGIADLEESYPCNADFWVLVDGKVRFSMKNVRQKGVLKELAVEIGETDRFLTLVTTDGGDVDMPGAYNRAITCDWCVFVSPALELE